MMGVQPFNWVLQRALQESPNFFRKLSALMAVAVFAIAGSCANPTAPPASPGFKEAIESVKNYRDANGKAPTKDFYYELVESVRLTGIEQSTLYLEVIAQQNPMIAIDDLVSIIESKRDSISSFRCRYVTSDDPDEVKLFAFDENKLLVKDKLIGIAGSYDGNIVRIVETPTSAMIQPRNSLARFDRDQNALYRARLFNQELVDQNENISDLSKYVRQSRFSVLEELTTIGDSKCLMITDLSSDIYLDIDRNFAVKKIDSIGHGYETDAEGMLTTTSHSVEVSEVHTEFEDFGNGIWLAKKSTLNRVGQPESFVQTLEIEVNPSISATEFTGIIPDDAQVMDAVRDLVYQAGNKASINETINGVVAQKPHYTLVWVNIILLVFAASFFAWRQLRRKSNSQPPSPS